MTDKKNSKKSRGRTPLPPEDKLHPVTLRLRRDILDRLPPPGDGRRADFIRGAIEDKLSKKQ